MTIIYVFSTPEMKIRCRIPSPGLGTRITVRGFPFPWPTRDATKRRHFLKLNLQFSIHVYHTGKTKRRGSSSKSLIDSARDCSRSEEVIIWFKMIYFPPIMWVGWQPFGHDWIGPRVYGNNWLSHSFAEDKHGIWLPRAALLFRSFVLMFVFDLSESLIWVCKVINSP